MGGTELKKRDAAAERCIKIMSTGDISALEELYSLASTPIYSYALSVLGDRHEAEDVLHDAMVRIYAASGSYRQSGKPFSWMMRITKNLCIDRIRQRKRETAADFSSVEIEQKFDSIADAEDRLMIDSFLSALAPEERQIIVLHDVAGLTFRETAKALMLPAPTVMTKYRRAMIKLKSRFEETEGGSDA